MTAPYFAQRYPASPIREVRETFHGIEIVDPYRWLEDPATRETRNWVVAQDSLTRRVLRSLPSHADLEREFSSLVRKDRLPLRSLLPPRAFTSGTRSRYFQLRRPAQAQQSVLYFRDGPRGRLKVVVNPQRTDREGTTSILQAVPSWDGTEMVFGLSVHGSDRTDLTLCQVASGRTSDLIPNNRYGNVGWLHDGSGFYYSNWPEPGTEGGSKRPHVFFHQKGTAAARDRPVFGEELDPAQGVADLVLDPSDRHLVILVERLSSSSELYHLDRRGQGAVRPLVTGLDAFFVGEGSLFVRDDHVIGVTDYHAPLRRVVSVPIENPDPSNWQELVPEATDVLEGMSLVGGRMVLRYLAQAASRLKVRALDGTPIGEVPLPDLGTVVWPPGEGSGDEAVFAFTSFQDPPALYRCRPGDDQPKVLDRSPLPSPRSWLATRQVRYPSKDGTEVTMFLVHRKDMRPNGCRPALLEGYGGFGLSYTPSFDYEILPFLRAGGIYAVPNLRGGGEYGKSWHDAGKRELKQNVFDDFAAAAEWIIEQGYTDSRHLAVKGFSNGGLLVGALITQRPELVRAAVCGVPLLDMLRYQHFSGGPLWVPEYGSSDDPTAFRYLSEYSPYHRVRPGVRYPAVLLLTADTDTRVEPLHARKMAARLQASSSSGLPVLLRVERKAGHGFGKSVAQTVGELTDVWSFLYDQLDVHPRARGTAG